ncbi:hypothetical protein ABSDF1836 [Acinetobacter baumannii SDF]|uniref:Glutathione S-transferase n=1 Tax=Acinetobacter baumannii (strain SDF) TaxID=509170 RepID=B0VNU5_ACIBS|nr:hypothetical protein ABSDF1836 [Acinetobacter baumannii SDF]
MVNHQIKVLQALASAIAEGGRGVTGTAFPKQPVRALKLYEFEGSPFCRRIREVITLLNLDGLCCTNLLKADFTKSYQIQGTTRV